jgi:hypothetical protein
MICQSTRRELIQCRLIKTIPVELFSQYRRESGGYNLENAENSRDRDVIVTGAGRADTSTGTACAGTLDFPQCEYRKSCFYGIRPEGAICKVSPQR